MPIKRLSEGGKVVRLVRPSQTFAKPSVNRVTGELADVVSKYKNRPGLIRTGIEEVPYYGRLPTGILSVDLCLAGGFMRSRGSMIVGEKSTGKSTLADKTIASAQREEPDSIAVKVDIEGCIAADTMLLDTTTGRVYRAEEVFRKRLRIIPLSYHDDGRLRAQPIIAWFDNGLKPVYLVRGSTFCIKTTGNHRFLVFDNKTGLCWVRADELAPGMFISRPRSVSWDWSPVEALTPEQSRLLGYLVGDGHMPSVGSVTFSNIDDDAIDDLNMLSRSQGVQVTQYSDRHFRLSCDLNGEDYTKLRPNPVSELARRVGLAGHIAVNKFIPSEVMNSTPRIVGEFLSGLYITDGSVHPSRPTLSYCTTSEELALQVCHLWSRFGITAKSTPTHDNDPNHSIWYQVIINGRKNLRIAVSVLRLVGYKERMLTEWCSGRDLLYKPSVGHYYPDYNGLRHWRLREAYENTTDLYWEKVKEVSFVGEMQTYDFTVDSTHNYVANDVVVHNTHDPAWSQRLGVDLERLLVVEPESGEEAVDIADGLFRTMEVSIVVTDSIAMITPMKEIQESAETSIVGVHARLIGNYLRRLNTAMLTERHRGHFPCLLHINQFRMKIGVMFGDPRVLPGGKALEFSTSQQIQTYNKEHQNETTKEVDYNEHEIHVTKDKTGGRLKVGKFKLSRSSDSGYPAGTVQQAKTMIAYGTIAGIVTGKYQLGSFGRFRSSEEIDQFLAENPEASRSLCAEIVEWYRAKWGVS